MLKHQFYLLFMEEEKDKNDAYGKFSQLFDYFTEHRTKFIIIQEEYP